MRYLACIVVAFLLLSGHRGAVAASPSDDAAIKAVVAEYMASRDHQDAAALGKLFTPDVDQLVSDGQWRRGHDALVQGTLQSSRNSGGRRTITIETIRYLDHQVAIADGRYELSGLANSASRKMWTTFVLLRSGSAWKIAAIRNMLPAAPTPRKQ